MDLLCFENISMSNLTYGAIRFRTIHLWMCFERSLLLWILFVYNVSIHSTYVNCSCVTTKRLVDYGKVHKKIEVYMDKSWYFLVWSLNNLKYMFLVKSDFWINQLKLKFYDWITQNQNRVNEIELEFWTFKKTKRDWVGHNFQY